MKFANTLTSIILLLLLSTCFVAKAQDNSPTIAVPMAKSDQPKHQKYLAPITQKITEMLRSSKRFVVVSRTDEDVRAERQFQKSEEFLDRQLAGDDTKDLVNPDSSYKKLQIRVLENGEEVFLGAQYILMCEIRKLDIIKILNHDNTTAGYKALLGITLSVNTTATNTLSAAQGFQSLPIATAMLSPERAVDEAILTLENQLLTYFTKSFPIICQISKTMGQDVMINVGSKQGVANNDKFKVTATEQLGNENVEVEIGELRVQNIASPNYSQCAITKGKKEILDRFARAQKLTCTLIIKQ